MIFVFIYCKTIYLQNINILNINSNYFIKLFNKIINDIKNKLVDNKLI